MNKEDIKELISYQSKLGQLVLEERANEKTAVEVTDSNICQLLIAAFEAVNKVVETYLVKF